MGGGVGIVQRTAVSGFPSPVSGTTVLWDSTARTWKYYNGTAWKSATSSDLGLLNAETDFSCVGDDSTDNTSQLTELAAAMTETGLSGLVGARVWFPPGIYRHSGTIAWPRRTFHVEGATPQISVLKYTGSTLGHTTNWDGSDVSQRFSSIGFVNNTAATSLFESTKPGRLTFDFCLFRAEAALTNMLKIVGDTQAAQQTMILGTLFNGNFLATNGLTLAGSTFPGIASTTIYHGRINQCVAIGLNIAGAEGVSVHKMNVEGQPIGVSINGGRALVLDGLWYESNTTADIQMTATALSTTDVTVSGSSRWATSTPSRNIDCQTPGGGLTVNDIKIIGQRFTGAATNENIRFQTGVGTKIVMGCTFSNATEITDVDQNADRIANTYANGTKDTRLPIATTATLPAGAAALDGTVYIENAGPGDINLVIYGRAGRYRIDGGGPF